MAPWPLPKEYQHGSTTLWLSREVELTYETVEFIPNEEAGLENAPSVLIAVL